MGRRWRSRQGHLIYVATLVSIILNKALSRLNPWLLNLDMVIKKKKIQ